MNYQIHITHIAEQDLNEAMDYIEYVLKNPDAADRLIDLVDKKIRSLSSSPKLNPVLDDSVLHSWGIRSVSVNNYLIFYTVDEKSHLIYIVRFLYGKRDWAGILRQNIPADDCQTDM